MNATGIMRGPRTLKDSKDPQLSVADGGGTGSIQGNKSRIGAYRTPWKVLAPSSESQRKGSDMRG